MSRFETLPIEEARHRFLEAARPGDTVVLAAPTGSGKSTRIPPWLAEGGRRVLVVQPRRVACRALAQWVSEQRGETLGQSVGYRVRFEDVSGPGTQILFVTPGMALTMLAEGNDVTDYGALMLDEFHERSAEVDLLATLARSGRFGPQTTLVLCSATLDTQRLVAELGAALVTSQGRTFPVQIEQDGDGPPSARDLEGRVSASVKRMLGRTDGDVLVFLPGKREIEGCRSALRDVDADPVVVHGGVPPRELTAAFRPSSRRRVFLATNVAETSLTIPSVTAVVDSGLARMRVHQGGRAVLAVVPISAASMQQRAGRAGRVGPGMCVQLWSSRFEPDAVTPPEVERIELDDVVLRAGLCGLQPRDLADAPWITALPAFALQRAVERLQARGAIDPGRRITALGRAQAELPVSWLGARILAEAPRSLAGTLADIVAVIEVGRDLLLPLGAVRREPLDAALDEARSELFDGALDEIDVQLRCLRRGDVRRHGLHPSITTEARRLADQLRRRVGAAEDASFDRQAVVRHLLARVPDTAFVPRAREARRRPGEDRRSTSRSWGNGQCELQLRDYPIPSIPPERQPEPPEAALVLDWEWLGQGRGSRGVGRLMMRCTHADLVQAGLGEIEVGRATIGRDPERGGARTVVAAVERTHAGVVLERSTAPLRGEALCRAVADLLLRGAIKQELGHRVLDALHHWDLIAQTLELEGIRVDGIERPPNDRVAHVAQRLRELGVETLADVDLLDADDVSPALEDRVLAAGVSPRLVHGLLEDFPRRFAVPGGQYACIVDLRRRVVVIEPADDKTRREPAAKLVPRFRGFAVQFRKASRIVRVR